MARRNLHRLGAGPPDATPLCLASRIGNLFRVRLFSIHISTCTCITNIIGVILFYGGDVILH